MLFLILLCFSFLLSLIISIVFYLNEYRIIKIPGPVPLPFIGNGHLFLGSSSRLLILITKLIHEYGDIFRVYVLSLRYVFVVNPKYVEMIISNSDYNTKAAEYNFLHRWLGQGLLTSSGQRWRTHRKFLTPAFHFNILKTFLPIFLKNNEIFVKKLEHLADGQPVDVFPVVALLALDNISESAMGVSIDAQKDSQSKYVKAVNEISEIIFNRMRNMFLRFDVLFNLSPHKIRHDKAVAVLHDQSMSVIRNRRKLLEDSKTTLDNYDTGIGLKKKSAFLDLMLLTPVEGRKLDDNTIREEVDTFMFEGHDTTTSGISFALYCISQNSIVQEKLLEEQNLIFGEDIMRQPSFNDVNEMKYLDIVIKESLRLYPSVPIVGRMVMKDTKIGEYFIPKGTTVMMGIMDMQRNARVFEDPLAFRPERFETMNSDQKSAYNWIAFSAGPRNCIGQKFAMMEMKVILSSVIRRFQMLPSDIAPVLCSDLILRSQNGVHVKLLLR